LTEPILLVETKASGKLIADNDLQKDLPPTTPPLTNPCLFVQAFASYSLLHEK
jgi:hypothetical protein